MINIKGVIGNEQGEVNLLSVVEQVQKEKSDHIEVHIDSIGGDLDVGLSIYNYLLNLPQTVTTVCDGNCASAASIIFLSGDTRIAGCPIMIHNPYIESVSGDRDILQAAADWIGEAETTLEKAYAQRTKLDTDTLSELMKAETYLSPNQAVSLGFATQAKTIALAKLNKSNINKNENQMSEEIKSIGTMIREYFSKRKTKNEKETKPKVYNMDLITATGDILTIDREEGAPQIGDKASPDGVYTMEDGTAITVENGVISNIVTNENEENVSEGAVEEVTNALDEVIKDLETECDALKEELALAKKLAKTAEDIKILNAVRMAGGFEKLAKNFSSTYKPKARTEVVGKNEIQQKESAVSKKLAEIKLKKGIN